LNTEQTFDLCDYASFLLDFSKHGCGWRLAATRLAPRNCPLSFKSVTCTLANEKDTICLSNYCTDANYGFSHEKGCLSRDFGWPLCGLNSGVHQT